MCTNILSETTELVQAFALTMFVLTYALLLANTQLRLPILAQVQSSMEMAVHTAQEQQISKPPHMPTQHLFRNFITIQIPQKAPNQPN